MVREYSNFHRQAIEKVRHLWYLYIVNPETEELLKIFGTLPEDLLVIGTGRHELYKSRESFLSGMAEDQVEAQNIQFEMLDEWYEVQEITEDVCIVYGSIWAREKVAPGKAILVDMEGSRFTVVCRNVQGKVEICNIHHSMPYMDQGEGEYYPKSLSLLANEAVQRSKALERQVELDQMTELYNRVYMEWHVSQVLKTHTGYFYAIDLDGFKHVNDTVGHLVGDAVIREFARLLKQIFSSSALLGRLGGDEFAVWDEQISGKNDAENKFYLLIDGCRKLSGQLGAEIGCSAGIVNYQLTGEDFVALYQRADQALYKAKAKGKGSLFWSE